MTTRQVPVQTYSPPAITLAFDPSALAAVRSGLMKASEASLRKASDDAMKPFEAGDVSPTDAQTARAWLVASEWTRRGVAPAFRGMPHHNPKAAGPTGAMRAMRCSSPGVLALLSPQRHHLIFARFVDLEWLLAKLGPEHATFAADTWNKLQGVGLTTGLAVAITQSDSSWPRHRFCDAYRISPRMQAGLTDFVTKSTARAIRAARNRADRVSAQVDAFASEKRQLPPEGLETRKQWALAIELAAVGNGQPASGPEVADTFTQITGRPVTARAALSMRSQLRTQLRLQGPAWNK